MQDLGDMAAFSEDCDTHFVVFDLECAATAIRCFAHPVHVIAAPNRPIANRPQDAILLHILASPSWRPRPAWGATKRGADTPRRSLPRSLPPPPHRHPQSR